MAVRAERKITLIIRLPKHERLWVGVWAIFCLHFYRSHSFPLTILRVLLKSWWLWIHDLIRALSATPHCSPAVLVQFWWHGESQSLWNVILVFRIEWLEGFLAGICGDIVCFGCSEIRIFRHSFSVLLLETFFLVRFIDLRDLWLRLQIFITLSLYWFFFFLSEESRRFSIWVLIVWSLVSS